jgi:UDP-3-O-[3-hydroxymyristoyl] N-acetylglucosamine deacetylase/3-hydroxyacyl-[acyl-carrier-protein] dehydratase
MIKMQRTIKKPASYSGVGLHTGNQTTVTFMPAPAGSGIVFVRTDLPGAPEIPADIDHVADIARGTTLKKGEAKVHTVEHILAALAGLELDNLRVNLDSSEPPVGDGSASPFVEVILAAGIEEQDSPKDYLEIDTPLFYSEKEKGIDLVVVPSDDLRITFMVDYRNPALGTQYTSLVSLEKEFVEEFAPARTFCFFHELEQLYQEGLAKGGNIRNALVICDEDHCDAKIDKLKTMYGVKEKIFVGKTGLLNDVPLRFPNEPCRHKALDLLGDLYLLGVPIKGHVLAARSGHAANVALVKKLREQYEKKQITTRYQKRAAGDFLLDINAILNIMPHRYPFLLVDRVLDIQPRKKVVAIKNVTINEPFFSGHFPGHPIMPGVLIVEAMAQAGGILLLNTVDNPENKLVYFLGIDGVRFRKPVLPGDQIKFELEMILFRRGTCKMQGKATVDGAVVTEATLMATIVDR